MAELFNFDDKRQLKLLIYGVAGSGKTRTAATAEWFNKTAPVLVLDCAGNPISIRDYDPRPLVLKMETVADLNAPYDFFVKNQPEKHVLRDKLGIDSNVVIKTLIIDSMTDLQRLASNKITGNDRILPGDAPVQATFPHYGALYNQMLNISYKFMELEINIIITCLEGDANLEKGEIAEPLLVGQSKREIPGHAEIVARVQQANQTRKSALEKIKKEINQSDIHTVMFFQSTNKFYAKDQASNQRLGAYMVNPTIEQIYRKVFKESK